MGLRVPIRYHKNSLKYPKTADNGKLRRKSEVLDSYLAFGIS